MRIKDYALIGDLQTSALVGRNGSVDWLCLPRFDSASCFTALLGEEKHGSWLIAPAGEVRSVSRRYREGTLVLETDFETADGAARVIDFMPPRDGGAPQLTRIVQGLRLVPRRGPAGRRARPPLIHPHYGRRIQALLRDVHGSHLTGRDEGGEVGDDRNWPNVGWQRHAKPQGNTALQTSARHRSRARPQAIG